MPCRNFFQATEIVGCTAFRFVKNATTSESDVSPLMQSLYWISSAPALRHRGRFLSRQRLGIFSNRASSSHIEQNARGVQATTRVSVALGIEE